MKKKVIRGIAVMAAAVLMLGCLAGCKKTECYWCNEMRKCEMIEFSVIGERNTCKECEAYLMPMSENLKELDGQ